MSDAQFQQELDSLAHSAKLLGMELERERIIKLLLDTYQVRLSDGSRVPSNHNDSLDETIALIKGDNE